MDRSVEFFLVRYVPNAVAEDQCNVGLLAVELKETEPAFVYARFLPNPKDLLEFDPDADVNVLDALFRELAEDFKRDPSSVLHMMLDSFSNQIRISEVKTLKVSGDLNEEMDRLSTRYIYTPSRNR
jgi:hypothetical protein